MSLQQIPILPPYPWPAPSTFPPAHKIPDPSLGTANSWTSPDRSSADGHQDPGDTEDALVQRAIDGDREALEELFAVNTERLRRLAFGVLRNKEDAEDALQDALLSAYRNLDKFQARSRFSTWLGRIVINSALMARRKKGLRPESSLDEILDSNPGFLRGRIEDSRNSPERACAQTELRALIDEGIQRLPPRLQAAFRVCTLAGLSTAESTALLGVHHSTLKARVFRARHQVVKSLRVALRAETSKSASRRGNRYEANGFAGGVAPLA